jgi:hypothetical protein
LLARSRPARYFFAAFRPPSAADLVASSVTECTHILQFAIVQTN